MSIFAKWHIENRRGRQYIIRTMENHESNSIFFNPGEDVVCPGCGEKLQPVDLESFPRCPYCDFEFAKDGALEDFVLSPLIKRWLRSVQQNFPNC